MKILLYILSFSFFVNCFAQNNNYSFKLPIEDNSYTINKHDLTVKEKKYDNGIRLSGFYWHRIISISPSYYIKKNRHSFDFGVQSHFNLAGYYEFGPSVGYKIYIKATKHTFNLYILNNIYLYYLNETYKVHYYTNNYKAMGFEVSFKIGMEVMISKKINIGTNIGIGYRGELAKGTYNSFSRILPMVSIGYNL